MRQAVPLGLRHALVSSARTVDWIDGSGDHACLVRGQGITRSAISSGSAARRIGESASTRSRIFGSFNHLSVMGVRTKPGAMALTRMPCVA
jgi:hypothetical protein